MSAAGFVFSKNVCLADLPGGMKYLVVTAQVVGELGPQTPWLTSPSHQEVSNFVEISFNDPLITKAFQQPNFTINAIAWAADIILGPSNHFSLDLPVVTPQFQSGNASLHTAINFSVGGNVSIQKVGVQIIVFTWPAIPD
jgi:hypothetical protein